MTSGPEDYDGSVIILEDNASFIVPEEDSSHRVVLESHSLIETGNTDNVVSYFFKAL